MDWLGGGGTIVKNSFCVLRTMCLRCRATGTATRSRTCYGRARDVQNILIENSVLSTSISNVVRAAWPRKVFNARNFTLRDSDILHGGIGACGQTFGLLGFWGANGAKGITSELHVREPVSRQLVFAGADGADAAGVQGVTFRNIWELDQPPLVGSTIMGKVAGVVFDNVKLGQNRAANNADLQLTVTGGAEQASFTATHGPVAAFTVVPAVFAPGQTVTFIAQLSPGARFTWLFGDGTKIVGTHAHIVRHRFPDSKGTELDGANGAGRFRVLLEATDRAGHQDWASQGLVAVDRWRDATGLCRHDFAWADLADLPGSVDPIAKPGRAAAGF